MNILTLSIKQKYFDEILAGKKTHEYREIRPTNAKKYITYRQYGLGSARQRNIRDRTKSIMGRYAEKIDSYFSKRGVDVYGNKPISRRVYMGNNNG